jgi:hypothetical protein
MVATPLVEPYIEAGRELIMNLDASGFGVEAALWLYRPESYEWRLLIASPVVDERGPQEAYRKVQTFVHVNPLLSLRNVSVVSPTAEIIQALRRVIKTGPGISDIRMTANSINGFFIEDALIYRL